MKEFAKKIWWVLLLACVAAGALVTGLTLAHTNRLALADGDAATQISLQINDETGDNVTLVQGKEFTLKATFTTTHTTDEWTSVYIHLGPLSADKKTMDTSVYDKFSLVAGSEQSNFSSADDAEYDLIVVYTSTQDGLRISLGRKFLEDQSPNTGATELVVTAKMKLADDFPTDSSVQFGMTLLSGNRAEFNEGAISDDARSGSLAANTLTITVRDPSSDNTLKDLEVGHESTSLTSLASGDPVTIASDYTFNHDDLTSFLVKPTANDTNAKVEIALNNQVTFSEVTAGDTETLTLSDPATLSPAGSDNVLYVKVTAENGDAKTYSVTVKIGYVRLSAITADAPTQTTGVTKKGIDLSATSDAFDKDTFTYNVFVPSDYAEGTGATTGVQISATVLTGYGASETIALTATGCDLDPVAASMTSAGTVAVKNIVFPTDAAPTAPTLKLTATAADGTTTQDYTLTFVQVSVDATLDSITVKGVEQTEKTFTSDATQAANAGVDYYYLLTGETQKSASVALAAKSAAATIAVTWTDTTITETLPDYANPTVYKEGGYTVTITAEAGNTKEYKFVLAAALYLKLADTSEYHFLTEEVVDDDGEILSYRRTYAEMGTNGWEHGVDDIAEDFGKVVLGQILPETTVNAFVSNILASQLSSVRVYTLKNELIYDCTNPGDGFTADDLDDADGYGIGTGWRVEYGETGSADVVYLSVLGDVTGDGRITSADTSRINGYIRETASAVATFQNVENRLAAYVMNRGQIYSGDTSALNSIIRGVRTIDFYYYKVTASV